MYLLRRQSLPEALWLLSAAALTFLVFSATSLDISAARLFFRAEGVDHWPLAHWWSPSASNICVAFVATSALIAGLLSAMIGRWRGDEFWRVGGVFVLLSAVIAPALSHWNLPSPREVSEFGGTLAYTSPLIPAKAADSSLYGQCSVAFLYASGWWLWKRRRPAWARTSLVLGTVMGLAVGLGSMVRGEHFLSGIIWSALLALAVCHVLYYYVLQLQEQDASLAPIKDHPRSRTPSRRAMLVLLILAAGAGFSHREQVLPQAKSPAMPPLPQVVGIIADPPARR
jgi:lipid A 4'-phosphatase